MEVVNSAISHLTRVRASGAFYTHAGVTKGHTLRGQFLGAPAVFGGGGDAITRQRTSATERRTIALAWDRVAQNGEGGNVNGLLLRFHAIEISRVRRIGSRALEIGVRPQWYWSGAQPFNLNAFAALRPW